MGKRENDRRQKNMLAQRRKMLGRYRPGRCGLSDKEGLSNLWAAEVRIWWLNH